jgi:hypothetical protein
MTTYEKLQNDGQWFCFEIIYNLDSFLMKFGKIGVSGWYRLISNSPHLFLGKTNRQFFKQTFSEGFYRSTISNEQVKIVMFLRLNEASNKERIVRELVIRIKKLLFCRVNLFDIGNIPMEDKSLLSSSFGIQQYQKILESYKKGI